MLTDADPDKVLNDVKSSVDRIATFPQDSEKPQVTELSLRREVITLVLSGDQDLKTLHQLAEEARSDIRQDPNVTQVEVLDVPDLEMSVEVPQRILEAHGLVLEDIAISSNTNPCASKMRWGTSTLISKSGTSRTST